MAQPERNRAEKASPRSGPSQFSAPQLVLAEKIIGVHPSIHVNFYINLSYLSLDLCHVSLSAIELMLRSHPVGLTREDSNGNHTVVTGLRTWQIYQVASARALIKRRFIPAVIFHEAISDETICDMARVDTYLSTTLFSLAPSHSHTQLHTLQKDISDERWTELFGDSPRPSLPNPIPKSKQADTRLPTERGRGRGRPRIHPLPDPSVPKRGPGRPRKNQISQETIVMPSGVSGGLSGDHLAQ